VSWSSSFAVMRQGELGGRDGKFIFCNGNWVVALALSACSAHITSCGTYARFYLHFFWSLWFRIPS